MYLVTVGVDNHVGVFDSESQVKEVLANLAKTNRHVTYVDVPYYGTPQEFFNSQAQVNVQRILSTLSPTEQKILAKHFKE